MEKEGKRGGNGMDVVSKEVKVNVKEYFRESLLRYEVIKIRKKSYHPDDALYGSC